MSTLQNAFVRITAPMRPVVSVRTQRPEFVMTFDDGPTPGDTDEVLRALADAEATATFFVLMTRVNRARDLLRRVADLGHEIGLHGLDHTRLTTIDGRETYRRTKRAKGELEDALGRRVRWFRPPYGAMHRPSMLAVKAAGLQPVLWRGGVGDHLDLPQEERDRRTAPAIVPGGIVLLHDGYADAGDNAFDPPAVPVDRFALTSRVLELGRAAGLRGRSLGEVVEGGPVVRL